MGQSQSRFRGQTRRPDSSTERGDCSMTDVVQKLWGFCNTLRHDGIDYGDYIEQLTYLLFLKMADERSVELPEACDWPSFEARSGAKLADHYVDVLRTLGQQRGL